MAAPARSSLTLPLAGSLAGVLARSLLLALGGLVACTDSVGSDEHSGGALATPSAEDGSKLFALGPGDVLLDHLDRVQVLSHARTNLTAKTREMVDEFLNDSRGLLPASSWVAGGEVDPELVGEMGLYVPGTLHRYRCRPSLRLDLGLGRVRLSHGERLLSTAEGDVGDRRLWWFDKSKPMAFRWDGELGTLFAFGTSAPDDIVIEYDATTSADLLHWEGPAADPEALRRFSLAQVDRPALAVTTPSAFHWQIDRLSGDSIEVSVAVLDVGLVVDGAGRLERREGLGDGVTFRIDITVAGVTSQLWERHVLPGSQWTEESIPLPDTGSAPVALRFTTQPGPDGHRLNDHALWSGLRLRGQSADTDPRPHLVLIDLDTLRADRLGCYGAERDTSPRIDAWAESSAELFENATSVESWTLPSTISMLTGLAVSQHGVHFSNRRMTQAMQPLAARLSAAGYETLGRTDGGFVIPAMGFAEGFERFIHGHLQPGEDWTEVLELLAARDSSRPVFCFLQTYRAHEPYDPDHRFDDLERPYAGPLLGKRLSGPDFAGDAQREGGALDDADHRWVNGLYDSAVYRTDAMVGDFLDGLGRVFGDEPYLVLLTSDHGQALFDRGAFGHGLGLHPEDLAVPLILRHVNSAVVGRSSAPVTGLDIVPTLLEAAGLEIPDHLPGRSLLGPLPEDAAQVAWHRGREQSIQYGGYKLIDGGDAPQLFELSTDPQETIDRAATMPRRVEYLTELLNTWLDRWQPVEAIGEEDVLLSDADRAALEALGYLK